MGTLALKDTMDEICGCKLANKAANRSERDLIKSLAESLKSGTRIFIRVVLWGLRHFLFIFRRIIIACVFVALIADYRVIQESVDYYGSILLSQDALDGFGKMQMLLQFYVVRVTNQFTGDFPLFPYVEPEPGCLDVIYEYIRWLLCPVTALFGFKCK